MIMGKIEWISILLTVVQDEQKADGNIVLSCLEAALHALRQQFPHVTKLIVQNDNAKNLAGKQTKLCDTHFSHQQSQVEAYLVQRNGGRKVSTPKQFAVALMEKSLSNTTVLFVKPDFKAPYRSNQNTMLLNGQGSIQKADKRHQSERDSLCAEAT